MMEQQFSRLNLVTLSGGNLRQAEQVIHTFLALLISHKSPVNAAMAPLLKGGGLNMEIVVAKG